MTDLPPSDILRLPPRPTERERAPFPLLASIAPVVVALALWGITRSPFALLFAVLGPVIALASLADASRSTRRSSRRALAEHSAAIGELTDRIARRQRNIRRAAWHRHPSASDAFFAADDDARRWRSAEPGSVVLGSGTVPSPDAIAWDETSTLPDDARDAGLHGAPGALGASGRRRDSKGSRASVSRERAAAVAASRSIDDMPVAVDIGGGIGVVGAEPLVRAVLRGLLLQAVDAVPPSGMGVSTPATPEWEWTAELPHSLAGKAVARAAAGAPLLVVVQSSDAGAGRGVHHSSDDGPFGRSRSVMLAGAPRVALLPPGCAVILVVRSAVDAEVVRSPTERTVRLVPELVGAEHAGAHARLLGLTARRSAPTALPAMERFVAPEHPTGPGLAGVIGPGTTGPMVLDLVADGPHAVVGGTTGSGKSELLVTWIASMAAGRVAAEFTFLLVDFKGGATGTILGGLPHCVGVVTDLDAPLARRVLDGLLAEMRRREAVLADARVAAIDQLPPDRSLPRLVVVVDELAALLGAEPGMHALFSDIAARGRSLGLHLILCTQRPAGVVRESLLANCALRISLRVIDGADSAALIGSPAAALIPVALPGRCLIARHGRLDEAQVATTTRGDLALIARRSARQGSTEPQRPWLPPLPPVLQRDHPAFADELAPGTAASRGVVIGLLDRPALQAQPVARWSGPALLIQGGAGSGRTTSLARIAAECPGVQVVPADVEGTWDALDRAERGELRMLLLDDWDAVSGRWPAEYRQTASDRLADLLHGGTARIAVTVRRSGVLGSVAGLFGSTIVLRTDDRNEHVLAGAPADLWDPTAPPGRGVWEGARLQVLAPDPRTETRPSPLVLTPAEPPLLAVGPGPLLAVSSRPERFARRLAGTVSDREIRQLEGASRPDIAVYSAAMGPVLVGRSDVWQSQPALFAALAARATLVFDGCSTSEVRQLTRVRELPPPLRAGAGRVWVQTPEGGIRRARIDE
ncbi:FtsK/SpoIIIE domain-containing protein [Leifsonia sp. YIM 134122]|uniref:FtsK/SpoIIIE domain-containing protein n=1 Tax=Leifsonia stereocauli TaxID=3134136 RepID=A0ABU9W332_9MICO